MRTFNDLYFDGQSLRELGVTVSQKNRYDAPERDIEEVEVPGRNGNYIIDKKRFKNVPVSYHINIEDDFERKAPLIRKFLLGLNGSNTYEYKILTDTYDPEEYREAVYSGNITFDVKALMLSGECDITFNCMPQRYSSSDEPIRIAGAGESRITILSASEAWSRYKTYFSSAPPSNPFKDGYDAYNWVEVFYEAPGESIQDAESWYVCVESSKTLDDVFAPCMTVSKIPADSSATGYVGIDEGTQAKRRVYKYGDKYFIAFFPVIAGIKVFATKTSNAPGHETWERDFDVDIPESERVYLYKSDSTVTNVNVPSLYPCLPLIEFEINSATNGMLCSIGTKGVYVDITQETYLSMPSKKIVLDTESMEMTCNGKNFNKYVFFDGDIKLEPGDNDVAIGSCSYASITRRWYTI